MTQKRGREREPRQLVDFPNVDRRVLGNICSRMTTKQSRAQTVMEGPPSSSSVEAGRFKP